MQYGEMFRITAIVCVVGAILALMISGRHEHAEDVVAFPPNVDGDDSPTQMIDAQTQAIPTGEPDRTERIQASESPPGKHRR